MDYRVSTGHFDRKRHSRTIEKIGDAHSGVEKEPYFKNIAGTYFQKKGLKT